MDKDAPCQDQKKFVDIVRNKNLDLEIRKQAVHKIINQRALGDIADDINEELIIRIFAISNITDKSIMEELSRNRDKRIRSAINTQTSDL